MDLTEFYAEIQAKPLDTAAIQSAIQNRIVSDPASATSRPTHDGKSHE
jgi:hypothetical protein